MDNLKFQLENAFEKVTPKTGQKIIKKVRTVEDRFFQYDAKLESFREDVPL